MSSNAGARRDTILDATLDVLRMRQYFNVIVRARDVAAAVRKDATFLDAVRRGLLPLPIDRRPEPQTVFGAQQAPLPLRR
jgi:hypothetical protein